MATTKDIINNFLWGHTNGKASGGRLYIEGNKLINYGTTIAQRIDGRVVLNKTKYSPTTSKHQNVIHRECPNIGTVQDIPMGTWCLERFLPQNA